MNFQIINDLFNSSFEYWSFEEFDDTNEDPDWIENNIENFPSDNIYILLYNILIILCLISLYTIFTNLGATSSNDRNINVISINGMFCFICVS